ncbi:MAG: hypothetical protein NTU62_07480 [Spirochaetes bacterium]|nr:hypothetical protein [Spirochaetota bacterium]
MGGRFLEALLFAVSSLVLYSFGVGRVLFLVPLQVASVRRGTAGLAAAGGIAVVGLAAIRLAGLLPAPFEEGALLASGTEVAVFLLLAAGLAAANLRLGDTRALVRLLAAAAAVCLAGAPLVAVLAASPAIAGLVDKVFADTSRMLQSIFATGDSVAGTMLEALIVPDMLKMMIRESLLNSFVLAVFAFLAFSWWAGSVAGSRASGSVPVPRWRFSAFRLEGWWLWPLIASLALVLADLLRGDLRTSGAWLSYASYAAWNAALVMLFLFGLQGLAILRFWLEKRGLARFVWPLAVAAVLAALVTPRLNVVAAVALPLFGASENWVRYRSGSAAAT